MIIGVYFSILYIYIVCVDALFRRVVVFDDDFDERVLLLLLLLLLLCLLFKGSKRTKNA